MDNRDAQDDEWEDEEENLSIPAGKIRVVVGLIVMAGSVVAAGISRNDWVKFVGVLLFLSSPFIMLKRPDKDTGR